MQNNSDLPLIVDLDRTLTLIDTLEESVINVAKRIPLNIICLPIWILKGRVAFNNAIAARSNVDAELLPCRKALIDYLTARKKRGRKIILATAAHSSIAEPVSAHLGRFDGVQANGGDVNLRGRAKLESARMHWRTIRLCGRQSCRPDCMAALAPASLPL